MITSAQRKQMKAVLNNQPTNPPSPHLTPAEKHELRTLIDAGREDDAWAELHYKSQAAIGNAMESVMRKSREIEKTSMARKDYAAPTAKVNDASVAAITEPATNKPAQKQRRFDALGEQLDQILADNKLLTTAQVAAILRKSINSNDTCILNDTGDGFEWQSNNSGNNDGVKNITLKNLGTRIDRWKQSQKHNDTLPPR